MTERETQAAGVKLLRSLKAAVWVLGTVRRRSDYHGTMQTPGIPDVKAFLPGHVRSRRGLWWEVKTAKGRLRPGQAAFRDLCEQAGESHVVGDLDALIAWLTSAGYLKATAANVVPPSAMDGPDYVPVFDWGAMSARWG